MPSDTEPTKQQFLQLMVKEDAEPIQNWASLCKDPITFLTEVATRLVAFGTFSTDVIIISDKIPAATDRRKFWIKTSWPYGMGFVVEGVYQMDYGMSQYPVRTPFMKLPSDIDPLPGFVREIDSSEILQYGIPPIRDKETTTNPMKWYIFEPPAITY